ncbi:hypothetical protein PINS_up005659 [Pythium insidiosum]|nr:hypothetical protein PINS_up005659 [Pythium insidiosum]
MLARRDDHNPFFQLSATLNTWLLLDVLGWAPETTQLVYLDDGLPSPVDALQKAVLSPAHDVVRGRELMGHVLRFDELLIAPFEYSGPMMQHLDDAEPCRANRLLSTFRRHALETMDVPLTKEDPDACVVTVITRRPYQGRMVQRKWLNEAAVLDAMRQHYANASTGTTTVITSHCVFQSVDFVELSLREQMRVVRQQRRDRRYARRWHGQRALVETWHPGGRDLPETPTTLGIPQFVPVRGLSVAPVSRWRGHWRRRQRQRQEDRDRRVAQLL